MWKNKLCLGLMRTIGTETFEPEAEIRLISEAGFEGFFSGWGEEGLDFLKRCRDAADAVGMEYQSVHAPFGKVRDIWHGGPEAAKAAAEELTRCLEDCASISVPIMVAHAFIGFEDHRPNQEGLDRFEKVIWRAGELGVMIAFENTEGMEYLDAVMQLADNYEACMGFCWDTGHEMCYNWSRNMPAKYPGRLIATHINDNLGIRDHDGSITWTDDLHLLPFDGIGDWEYIARQLKDFTGPLTFELTTQSKPGRHENDKYALLSASDYLAEAYGRACRVATLVEKARSYRQNIATGSQSDDN